MHKLNHNYNRVISIDFLFTIGNIYHLPILCFRPRARTRLERFSGRLVCHSHHTGAERVPCMAFNTLPRPHAMVILKPWTLSYQCDQDHIGPGRSYRYDLAIACRTNCFRLRVCPSTKYSTAFDNPWRFESLKSWRKILWRHTYGDTKKHHNMVFYWLLSLLKLLCTEKSV